MIEDRNKSELTHAVTRAAVVYLEARGCKPIETEVGICPGWVADLAGVIVPTQTELRDLKLIRSRPAWSVAAKSAYQEWYDDARALQRIMTCLVEVKTSRADFLGDRKWNITELPVDLAYLAMPKVMTKPVEWPNGWGILEYEEGSGCVKLSRPPVLGTASAEQQRDVILSVAVRRDHHTRYERFREQAKEERIRRNEEMSATRVIDCVRAMVAIVEGKHESIDGALARHIRKNKIPAWLRPELEALWNLKNRSNECVQSAGAGVNG